MVIVLDQRPAGLDGQLDHVRQRDRFLLEVDLAAGDPRNIKQIVDHARHVLDLVFDHLGGPSEVGTVGPFQLHDLDGVADGRQGIAQFVGEHGQELVLALVGVFEGFFHAFAVVDVGHDRARAQQGPVGQLDGVEIAEPVTLLAGDHAGVSLVTSLFTMLSTGLEHLPE